MRIFWNCETLTDFSTRQIFYSKTRQKYIFQENTIRNRQTIDIVDFSKN